MGQEREMEDDASSDREDSHDDDDDDHDVDSENDHADNDSENSNIEDDNHNMKDSDNEENESIASRRLLASSATTTTTVPTTTLSKNWSIQKTHIPIYTGGKITYCALHDCLLTPVFGNICLVDYTTSVRICTVRGSGGVTHNSHNNNDDDEDDEDDDMLDMDAITAYAVAPNQSGTIITCSQNSILRQYTIIHPNNTATVGRETSTESRTINQEEPLSVKSIQPQQQLHVQLDKQWGKSGHTLPVTDIQFHCSGVFVATASIDGTVRIWDMRGAFVTHCFRPNTTTTNSGGGGSGTLAVTAIAWFPQVQHLILAIARDDGSICIHNLRHNEDMNNAGMVVVLRDHVSAVTSMVWHIPTRVFITTGRDAVINVWKYEHDDTTTTASNNKSKNDASSSGKRKKKHNHNNKDPDTSSRPTYNRILTHPVYEQVEGLVLLNPASDSSSLSTHSDTETQLYMATAGSKGLIRLWCLSTEGKLQMQLHGEQTNGFGQARGGYLNLMCCKSMQLAVSDAEHNVSFLEVDVSGSTEKTAEVKTIRSIVGHNDEVLDLKVVPNTATLTSDGETSTNSNRKIVVATNSAQVRIFDLDNFACDILEGHTATVLCVDVSPCGRYIATCGKDKQMRLWETSTLQCVAIAVGHTEAVGSTALSRVCGRYDVSGKAAKNGAGSFAVTVSMDRTLKRWNLGGIIDLVAATRTGTPLDLKAFCSARAHEKDINIVSIAPNDSLIATGSQDKTVKLWKSTDLSLVATLKGHRRGVWDVCFSPFDRIVATSSGDKTLKIWSLSDYSCVRTFQGHVSSVLRVRFLCGGLQLVSSGADGLVKLWTIRTNECEATMDLHRDKVWALDLAPNGKELVSGGADSQIAVWVDTTKEVNDAKKAEEKEAVLIDQKLSNHLRRKEYGEALEISIERDKPHHTLKVLNAIVESDLEKGMSGLTTLKTYAASWNIDQLVRILRYCREWNTRARNSHISLLTIKAIVTTVPANTLAEHRDVPEILAGIIPYAERHFDRLDRLHTSSYLLDFALASMGSVEASTDDNALWESQLVLPPNRLDGRVDVGGKVVVGAASNPTAEHLDSDNDVVTIGNSDDSDDEI